MQNKFSIIVSNTARSVCYLKELKLNKLVPENIIYVNDLSNNKTSKLLKKRKFFFESSSLKVFNNKMIDKKISSYLLNLKSKNIIYSGYPGIIIKEEELLNQKNLIHAHPGKLPEYKGSTTIYYSILKEKKIYCSTIILNKKIDGGKILTVKKYPLPKNIKLIDKGYDNLIRAKNIIYFLKNFKRKIFKKNIYSIPYYVIHPILRSIVLYKKK
tara:strand:+ start:346 stop:984 length:639 start_codon:yes stop_codon:yes gene_type:complete